MKKYQKKNRIILLALIAASILGTIVGNVAF